MSFQSPIRSTGSVPTLPREPKPHSCGLCRNPFTGGRDDCPNNRRVSSQAGIQSWIGALAPTAVECPLHGPGCEVWNAIGEVTE